MTAAHELNGFGKGKTKYRRVALGGSLGQPKFSIHRLVAMHFLKLPRNHRKLDVNHLDGNPANNHYSNLEWIGRKAHILKDKPRMAARIRLSQLGENNSMAKYTNEVVLAVDRALTPGANQQGIAREFGVSESMVSNIKTGKAWPHLTGRGQ